MILSVHGLDIGPDIADETGAIIELLVVGLESNDLDVKPSAAIATGYVLHEPVARLERGVRRGRRADAKSCGDKGGPYLRGDLRIFNVGLVRTEDGFIIGLSPDSASMANMRRDLSGL